MLFKLTINLAIISLIVISLFHISYYNILLNDISQLKKSINQIKKKV